MMAKPFYSIEEVCAKLGRSPDQVKALVRDGSLREFRDGGKVFFKAEDVDKLAGGGSKADTGEILLEAADDPDETPPLVASTGGTSVIGLEPLPDEDRPKKKDDTVITASGIGVFDEDEIEIDADPMAKTHITTGSTGDQVTLEGTGSGSGLLDLTREADDTSLGAELLDEIYPGEEESTEAARPAAQAAEAEAEEEATEEQPIEEASTGEVLMPVIAATGDPAEGPLSGLLVGSVVLMAVAAAVVAGVLQGFLPDYARTLSNYFYWSFGGAFLITVLAIVVGWFVGKASAPRRR